MPLDVTIDILNQQGCVPDWCGFIEHAIRCGWHLDRTVHRLEIAVLDIYGQEYFKVWREKMSLYLKYREARKQSSSDSDKTP